MKKVLLSLMVIAIVLSASQVFAAKKWKLFFKAKQEVIDQVEGKDVLGYKLGPNNYVVQISKVVNILTVGPYHCILYITDSTAIANKVKDWDEFMGFGYIDMVMRVAQGLSDIPLSDIEYLTGAHWFSEGEWHFGNVKNWKADIDPATNLPYTTVYFGRLRDIMGVDLH